MTKREFVKVCKKHGVKIDNLAYRRKHRVWVLRGTYRHLTIYVKSIMWLIEGDLEKEMFVIDDFWGRVDNK